VGWDGVDVERKDRRKRWGGFFFYEADGFHTSQGTI
jgi:hypothetical protein